MTSIKFLGDVHLGKRFKHGVPLDRRGDRERMQWDEFERNLMEVDGYDLHIQVGDLFDEAIVPYWVVMRAAQAYLRAAITNPDCTYIVLRGNHDASRDMERVTAFAVFSAIVRDRVRIIDEHPRRFDEVVCLPWHPVLTAEEMVAQHADLVQDADITVGHWDVVAISNTDNLLPAAQLRALGVKRAVTGHDHNARELELEGLPITVTGSMQPYSHSEDPGERFYVTRTLDEVLLGPDGFVDKALRVRLKGDEVLDVPIDCLQLTLQREGAEMPDEYGLDVEFEAFNLRALFDQAAAGLPEALRAQVWDKLSETHDA